LCGKWKAEYRNEIDTRRKEKENKKMIKEIKQKQEEDQEELNLVRKEKPRERTEVQLTVRKTKK
jgi:hypothetical protein